MTVVWLLAAGVVLVALPHIVSLIKVSMLRRSSADYKKEKGVRVRKIARSIAMLLLPGLAFGANAATPVATCQQFMYIVDRRDLPWNVAGADTTVCGQTAVGLMMNDYPKTVAAFKGGMLVGVRDYPVSPPIQHLWTEHGITDATWVSHGSTPNPGELWWGLVRRNKQNYHIAIGQETYTRYATSLQPGDMRRLLDLMSGKAVLPLAKSPEASFSLLDATPVTSEHYLGGDGLVADGQVTAASLQLHNANPMQATLHVTLEIEGISHDITLYLKRNIIEKLNDASSHPDDLYRLVQGKLGTSGAVADCLLNDQGTARTECAFHDLYPSPSVMSFYQATGHLFGPQGEYVAILYSFRNLYWNGPHGQRSNGITSGLLVMKME